MQGALGQMHISHTLLHCKPLILLGYDFDYVAEY
jgi:hypothetical protein